MSASEDMEAFNESSIEVTHKDGRKLLIVAYLTDDGEEVPLADIAGEPEIEVTEEDLADPGRTIMALLVKEVIRRFKNEGRLLKAADLEFVRKLSSDNSITFASVRRGDFGTVAQQVAEEFPFPVAVN